jgi:hypothetical protein
MRAAAKSVAAGPSYSSRSGLHCSGSQESSFQFPADTTCHCASVTVLPYLQNWTRRNRQVGSGRGCQTSIGTPKGRVPELRLSSPIEVVSSWVGVVTVTACQGSRDRRAG